ncbi:MAG: tetratricopeptide repeat protein [Proteobacteria bacterium]|nr:tetratricopeptide repeat protein [Pseudomonadota bacterium]
MKLPRLNRETQVMLSVAVIAFLTLYLFSPVQNFLFLNFDDNLYIGDNPFVRSGLTLENVQWAFTHFHGGHWHPLSWISHMADCQFFGLNPEFPHRENAIIHAFNACLFFFLLLTLLEKIWLALFGALLFAFHPMRMEAVAWVAERKELCAALFGMLTLLAYIKWIRIQSFHRKWLVMGLLTLGLLFKPTLVTLPVLFILLDLCFLQRDVPLKKILFQKLPFFLISVVSCVITVWAQKAGGGYRSFSEISLSDRLAAIPLGYLAYLGKLFWPTGYGIFYPFQRYAPGIGAGAWLSLSLITYLCMRKFRQKPWLFFGWFWFLISLAPVIGFVSVGGQSVADRWTYLSHLGLILGLLSGYQTLSDSQRKYLIGAALPALLICFYITSQELPFWRDSETIFTRTLEASPQNFMAHTNLGDALSVQGQMNEAAFHFEEAVRLHPGYSVALNNLGSIRAKQKRFQEAKALFLQALKIRPDFPEAKHNLDFLESYLTSNLNIKAE